MVGLCIQIAEPVAAQTLDDLTKLSIEDLGNIQVTSVSKRQQRLGDAPAAIYVITNDAIRRSGARTVPEALRLAPNLQVARRDAGNYAVSARGFNTFEASNKLLVLIDGRSVYTPLHSGVFWDQQSVMLQDIDRIEVISGPGGTLWGANAVNGVVNIITKSSAETTGGLVSGSRGNVDSTAAVRYGWTFGENASLRAYGMGAHMGDTMTRAGGEAGDDWENRQAGFRSDWSGNGNSFTLQSDLYNNPYQAAGTRNSGANILGRWRHDISETSNTSVQAYFDRAHRVAPYLQEMLETFDIEAQHRFAVGQSHDIVWGGGYRASHEEFSAVGVELTKPEDTNSIANIFLQDTISLTDTLQLTLGNKFEHNNYNGLETLPTARAAWHPTGQIMLWAAVSRAVRSPSRIDRGLQAAGLILPASDLKPDRLIAYEAGIRATSRDDTSLSLSFFYNDYDDLRVLSVTPGGLFQYANRMHGTTQGFEAWGEHRIRSWWRVNAGLSVLEKDLVLEPGATAQFLSQHAGNDPSYQASLRSSLDITPETEFDIGIRRVDELRNPMVAGYYALDARLGWRPTPDIELAVAGMNLLDDRHPETGDVGLEVARTIYASVQVKF